MEEYIMQQTKANFPHRNVEISWGKYIETSRNEGVKEATKICNQAMKVTGPLAPSSCDRRFFPGH